MCKPRYPGEAATTRWSRAVFRSIAVCARFSTPSIPPIQAVQQMPAARSFFGVGGTLALFLGTVLQRPEWFYRPGFEAADYDYVRKELSCPDIRLADLDLPCWSLPKTSLADFERQGFLILRQAWIWETHELENAREKSSWHPSQLQAIPLEAVHRLFREIQCFVAVHQGRLPLQSWFRAGLCGLLGDSGQVLHHNSVCRMSM